MEEERGLSQDEKETFRSLAKLLEGSLWFRPPPRSLNPRKIKRVVKAKPLGFLPRSINYFFRVGLDYSQFSFFSLAASLL